MKNKKRNWIWKLGLLGTTAVVVPSVLTSCSDATVYSTVAKTVTSSYSSSTYSNLSDSTITLKDAVFGSSYNNGNYVFIYGTASATDVLTFLYNDTVQKADTSNLYSGTSSFFANFFGAGGLGSGTYISGLNVALLMYIDIPVYDDNVTSLTEGLGPYDEYSLTDAVSLANGEDTDSPITRYNENNLPNEYKYLVGTYKRYDESAIQFRDLVSYIQTVRPDMTGTVTEGGIIAFKTDSYPRSFSLSSSSYSSIASYYNEPTDW